MRPDLEEEEDEEEVIIGRLESDLKELRGMTGWAKKLIGLAMTELKGGNYKMLRKWLEDLAPLLKEIDDKASYCLDMYRAEVLAVEDMLNHKINHSEPSQ